MTKAGAIRRIVGLVALSVEVANKDPERALSTISLALDVATNNGITAEDCFALVEVHDEAKNEVASVDEVATMSKKVANLLGVTRNV